MTEPWAVVVKTGLADSDTLAYGPFNNETDARNFAAFATSEIDPARAFPLRVPMNELLSWWNSQTGEL